MPLWVRWVCIKKAPSSNLRGVDVLIVVDRSGAGRTLERPGKQLSAFDSSLWYLVSTLEALVCQVNPKTTHRPQPLDQGLTSQSLLDRMRQLGNGQYICSTYIRPAETVHGFLKTGLKSWQFSI